MTFLLNDFEKHFMLKIPMFENERFLTDDELSLMLKVDRRTLKRYRHEGKISYYKINGKILYKESSIKKLLESNYHPAFNRSQL